MAQHDRCASTLTQPSLNHACADLTTLLDARRSVVEGDMTTCITLFAGASPWLFPTHGGGVVSGESAIAVLEQPGAGACLARHAANAPPLPYPRAPFVEHIHFFTSLAPVCCSSPALNVLLTRPCVLLLRSWLHGDLPMGAPGHGYARLGLARPHRAVLAAGVWHLHRGHGHTTALFLLSERRKRGLQRVGSALEPAGGAWVM